MKQILSSVSWIKQYYIKFHTTGTTYQKNYRLHWSFCGQHSHHQPFPALTSYLCKTTYQKWQQFIWKINKILLPLHHLMVWNKQGFWASSCLMSCISNHLANIFMHLKILGTTLMTSQPIPLPHAAENYLSSVKPKNMFFKHTKKLYSVSGIKSKWPLMMIIWQNLMTLL